MPSPTNKQLDVDALIVGAGPGGSTAAYHLALAERLASVGELLAAEGERLRAQLAGN